MHKGKKEIRIWRDGGSRLRKEKPDITLSFCPPRGGGGGVGLAENFPDKRPQIIQIPLTIKEAYFLASVFSEKDNY